MPPPLAGRIARGVRAATWRVRATLTAPLLDFALPTDCFACGDRLGALQHLGACLDCWAGLRPLLEPSCRGCGLPRAPGTDLTAPVDGRCAACRVRRPTADLVRALVPYDDHARRFLLRAKLGRRKELLRPIGLQLAGALAAWGWLARGSCIVPVPSHPWRALTRGFVPARELSLVVAWHSGLEHRRVLRRRMLSWAATKQLSAHRRRRAAAAAFRVSRGMAGARVLLIDDVMTTGATVEACSRALKQAGCAEVRAAVWARTLPGV